MLSKKINNQSQKWKKNSLISLCNLELAFKAKAKSSALENYRKQNDTKSPAKVEFKLRDKKKRSNKRTKKHVQAELFLTHKHSTKNKPKTTKPTKKLEKLTSEIYRRTPPKEWPKLTDPKIKQSLIPHLNLLKTQKYIKIILIKFCFTNTHSHTLETD